MKRKPEMTVVKRRSEMIAHLKTLKRSQLELFALEAFDSLYDAGNYGGRSTIYDGDAEWTGETVEWIASALKCELMVLAKGQYL